MKSYLVLATDAKLADAFYTIKNLALSNDFSVSLIANYFINIKH